MRTMIPSGSGDGICQASLKVILEHPGRHKDSLSALVWSLKTTIELPVRSETRSTVSLWPRAAGSSMDRLSASWWLKRVSYHVINRWISSVSPNDRTVVDTDGCAEWMNAFFSLLARQGERETGKQPSEKWSQPCADRAHPKYVFNTDACTSNPN